MGRPATKLDDAAVLEIVQAPRTMETYDILAEKFGCQPSTIRAVHRSRRGLRALWRLAQPKVKRDWIRI